MHSALEYTTRATRTSAIVASFSRLVDPRKRIGQKIQQGVH